MEIIFGLGALFVFLVGVYIVNSQDSEDKIDNPNDSKGDRRVPESVFEELPKEKQKDLINDGFSVIPGA